jgi:predicted permease
MDHGGRLTYIMGPVVGLVLLVACANVSGLLLGRHEQRRREIAVRLALGAGRRRIMSYLLAEGVWLALFGALTGLGLTALGIRMVPALLPPTLAMFLPDVRIDPRVLGLTGALAAFSTLAFGLMPAWWASRLDPMANLKTTETLGRRARSRQLLVVAQVAVAMLFLAVGALFVRGFAKGLSRELGFSERNLLLAYVALPELGGESTDLRLDAMRQAVAALPAVEAVGFGNTVGGGSRKTKARLPGAEEEASADVSFNVVDHGYFAALGIPLRDGRDFDPRDNRCGAPVVVVSEAMARRFWPGENPVGRSVVLERAGSKPCLVVGVVGNVSDLTERDPATMPACYLPWRQAPGGDPLLIVRTRRHPERLAVPVREALRRIDGNISLFMIDTLEGRLRATLMPQWFGAWIGGALGVLSFVLSITGLFGTVAYAVARRTREIGIRVALGASPHEAVWLVLRQGLLLAAAGAGVGLLLAVAAGRTLRGLLYGISPLDPVALAAATVLVVGVAALASWLPARRVTKVDPVEALRAE